MKIFVVTHKPVRKYGDEYYHLLQVGTSLHPEMNISNALKDNDGDNISPKNGTYCELTGLYYIWKNVKDTDITGLVHYRRFFVRKQKITKNPNEIILSDEEISQALKDSDIILGVPSKKLYGVGGYFTNPLDIPEFAIYRNIVPSIRKLYPEFEKSYYNEFLLPKMSFCNMMICSKKLLDEYCEFLFNVLFDAEKRWTDCGIGVAPREMGYISEYLLNCWVHHKQLKVCYKPIALFEDPNKLGIKVHYILDKLGVNVVLGPIADKLYQVLLKK